MTDGTTAQFTLIPYLYRDGSNYKEHGTLIAEGKITREQREAMQSVLDSDDGFIPMQLGLRHLGESMSGFPDDDDHPWHEMDLDAVEVVTGDPKVDGARVGDIRAFANRFIAEGRKGWDDTRFLDEF